MKDSPLDYIWIILVLALVFYLTWIATRFVASKSKGRAAGRFMRVVDRLNISNDKSILLVKIGSEYCVVGVTGHEISLIKALSPEEAEAFEGGARQEATAEWAPQGAAGAVWKGMQSFGDRLGFAMKRPKASPPRWQGRAEAEGFDRPRPKPPAEEERTPDEQSVIDMMNERIKLRKDSKWR